MQAIEQVESEFVQHVPCDQCGSRDNGAMYSDGHVYCFGCGAWAGGDGEAPQWTPKERPEVPLINGTFQALRTRKLTEETCRKFGYTVGKYKGETVQLATYRDKKGRPVAQKVRTKDKDFSVVGNGRDMTLFGSHLWSNGKILVICEGEIDAMSVSQMQNHKWPTVSLPNGAKAAKKALLSNYDYVTSFDSVVLMFDNDEPGREAAIECAEALPIGLCKIANLGEHKDANEALVKGDAQTVIQAIFQAKLHRPDGIVAAADLREVIGVGDAVSPISYPYSKLNDITKGLRLGSLVTIAAGSGVGKSTFVRELMYHVQQSGFPIGMMMLEESTKRTAQGLVGLHMNKNISVSVEDTCEEDIVSAFDDMCKAGEFYLFDHFGSTDLDVIVNRIRYMNKALGCQVICLDHISILISGLTSGVNDERRLVDDIMTRLRVEVQALGICLILVSHLRRPQGDKGHEGGAQVSLSQLRGSHAIAQLADTCIGLNVDAEDPTSGKRNIVVLKNRHTGEVGAAGVLRYDLETGRLTETNDFNEFEDIPF
jgi:twinkle protein